MTRINPGLVIRAIVAKLRTNPVGLYHTIRVNLGYEGRLIRWQVDLADWRPGRQAPPQLEVRRASAAEVARLTEATGSEALPYDFHVGRVHGVDWCYLGFWDGQLAHITWVFTRANRAQLVQLQSGEVEVRHCHTLDRFRGRGVFTAALQEILNDLRKEDVRTVYGHVLENNQASNRVFLKLGFRTTAIIGLRKTLGFNRIRILSSEKPPHHTS